MARQQNFLLLALLLFYCLPHLWLLFHNLYVINVNPSGRIDEGATLTIVTNLARDPAAYTNVIHQMIMPVIAAITAAGRRQILGSRTFVWLFALPLVTVFACLLNAALFDALSVLIDPSTRKIVSQFFINSASNLSVYVMLLVGLKVGGRPEATKG